MHSVSQLLINKEHWTHEDHRLDRPGRVLTVSRGRSVLDAARLMNEHHIGSLVVTDTLGEIVGIVSERDILTRVVTEERSPRDTTVGDVMTGEVICCDSKTTLAQARLIMRDRRIRHLPVIDDGALVGMISIGDLNAASNADLSIEVSAMREYITSG